MLKPANFPVAATVETDANLLGRGYAYASCGQLQACWFHSVRARDWRVLWLFEDYDDAVPFGLKFDGQMCGPQSIRGWQASRT